MKWAYQQPTSGREGEPIGTDHYACNRAQEDGIGREVGRKAIAALEQVPGEHTYPNNRRYVASSADVLCAGL